MFGQVRLDTSTSSEKGNIVLAVQIAKSKYTTKSNNTRRSREREENITRGYIFPGVWSQQTSRNIKQRNTWGMRRFKQPIWYAKSLLPDGSNTFNHLRGASMNEHERERKSWNALNDDSRWNNSTMKIGLWPAIESSTTHTIWTDKAVAFVLRSGVNEHAPHK